MRTPSRCTNQTTTRTFDTPMRPPNRGIIQTTTETFDMSRRIFDMGEPSTPNSESVNHVPCVDNESLFVENLLSLNVEQIVFYQLVEKATA
jgi:hypothetical protein